MNKLYLYAKRKHCETQASFRSCKFAEGLNCIQCSSKYISKDHYPEYFTNKEIDSLCKHKGKQPTKLEIENFIESIPIKLPKNWTLKQLNHQLKLEGNIRTLRDIIADIHLSYQLGAIITPKNIPKE